MKNILKLTCGVFAAVVLVAVNTKAQTTIAQWTFEAPADNAAITNAPGNAPGAGNSNGPVPADTDVPGGSVASGVHAAASTYSTPAGDVDLTLNTPATNPSIHSYSSTAWGVGDYYQFSVSTLGFSSVSVAWDQTSSNTGPGNFGLFYSVNGGAFSQFGATQTISANAGANAWNTTTAAPSSISMPGAGSFDNATMVFRVQDTSTTSANGGTVASGGTDRIDNFTVAGVAIPEPSTLVMVGMGILSSLAFARRRATRS